MCNDTYRRYECGCLLYANFKPCVFGPLDPRCVRRACAYPPSEDKCRYHAWLAQRYFDAHPYVHKPPELCLWADRYPPPMKLRDVPDSIRRPAAAESSWAESDCEMRSDDEWYDWDHGYGEEDEYYEDEEEEEEEDWYQDDEELEDADEDGDEDEIGDRVSTPMAPPKHKVMIPSRPAKR